MSGSTVRTGPFVLPIAARRGLRGRAWGLALSTCSMFACTSGADDPGPSGLAARVGLDLYLDATPAASVETDGGVTTTTFDVASGPRCMRGDPYRAATREGPSDDLLVFLQGGGACFSEFCFAVTEAPPGIPDVNVVDTTLEVNPFRDFDVAYAPYCDGSMFTGDGDVDEDGDGDPDRFHRGLANLSATLNVAKEAFPSPPRVVLAGSSGGAYGTFVGSMLVRAVFPEAELVLLADSGTGIARGPDDPDYVHALLSEHDALRFVPEDCADCIDNGHVTDLIGWGLAQDPNVRMGVFSSWYDAVIGDIFLQVSPEAHRDLVAEETGALHDAFPDRYRRFLVDGREHTTLLGDASGLLGGTLPGVEVPPEALPDLVRITTARLDGTELDGVLFSDWVDALIEGDTETWVDLVETPGPPPEVE